MYAGSFLQKHEVKKNLRIFNGFGFDKNSAEFGKKRDMLNKMVSKELKTICEALNVEKSGTKDELIERILEFLLEPKPKPKRVRVASKDIKSGDEETEKENDEEEEKDEEEDEEDGDDEQEKEKPKGRGKRGVASKTTNSKKKKIEPPPKSGN